MKCKPTCILLSFGDFLARLGEFNDAHHNLPSLIHQLTFELLAHMKRHTVPTLILSSGGHFTNYILQFVYI